MKNILVVFLLMLLAGCGSAKFSDGKVLNKSAEVSYYADKFNGRKTASGEKFSNNKLTAAHRKLPFGTKLKVTNLANRESVVVVVNDRGPFKRGRELDLSKKAFMKITDNKNHGILRVSISVVR